MNSCTNNVQIYRKWQCNFELIKTMTEICKIGHVQSHVILLSIFDNSWKCSTKSFN